MQVLCCCKFNPIIGVNSACRLGLLKFTEPVFENWINTTPIKSSELNIDVVCKTTRKLSPDKNLSCDKVSNVTRKLSPDKILSCDKVLPESCHLTKVYHVTKFLKLPNFQMSLMFQIFLRLSQEGGSLIMRNINICFRALAISNATSSP